MLHSFQQLNISILISLLISSTIPDNGTQFHIYTRKEHAGFIVNVEIQKQGYDFPGQRMSCYASDLLLRQYIKAKKMPDHSTHDFSYRDIKPVYVIVILNIPLRNLGLNLMITSIMGKPLLIPVSIYICQNVSASLLLTFFAKSLILKLRNARSQHGCCFSPLKSWKMQSVWSRITLGCPPIFQECRTAPQTRGGV